MRKSGRTTQSSKKALEAAAAQQALDAQADRRGKRPASPSLRDIEPDGSAHKQQRKDAGDSNVSIMAQLLEQQQRFQQQMSANMQRMEGQLHSIDQQMHKTKAKTLSNETMDRIQTEGVKLLEEPDAGGCKGRAL